jgi:hypothetical protein
MDTENVLEADEIEMPKSNNIARYGYRQRDTTLTVQFRNGMIYEYSNVPREIFEQMRHADSAGGFLAKNVKGQFEAHKRGETKRGAEV